MLEDLTIRKDDLKKKNIKKVNMNFEKGIKLKDNTYGWFNGELYKLREPCIPLKLKKSDMGGNCKQKCYCLGNRRYTINQLLKMTIDIEYKPSHKDLPKETN